MPFDYISTVDILFFMLYGVTGVVPLTAAVYLLLRRGNAFASDVTPPLRLRRWAAAFFAIATLIHVWWFLFYVSSSEYMSAAYVAAVMLDCSTMLTTIAGTLLAMLQDRRRPVWPVFAAVAPFVVMCLALMVWPSQQYLVIIGFGYILLVYLAFSVYVAFAVRQYGRWLRDNYADLERKEVWLTHAMILVFMLVFILYVLINSDIAMGYVLHLTQLSLFVLLLWRVETLPCLTTESHATACPADEDGERPQDACPAEARHSMADAQDETQDGEASAPGTASGKAGDEGVRSRAVDLDEIERLLAEHCARTQLYLQHDLTLQQLAQALGTNRSYLGQYFSSRDITYNTYINNLRINHFISLYHETVAARKPFTLQQLASDSGYRSYSTFSLAFKQRMGQSVTAWMRESGSGRM